MYKTSDKRPFAEVRLLGEEVLGLLDTCAAVSCIGRSFARKIIRSGADFKRKGTIVSTADGQRQQVVGHLTTEVEFKDQCKTHMFYLVPTLSQDLYLGIDFWRSLELLLSEFRVGEIPVSQELSEVQQVSLKTVVVLFLSFAMLGLGKTHLISHSIDVGDTKAIKQRHYPASPAVEKLLYGEVDRMMRLGVIEESQSACSSPVVLLQKPGKVRLCLDCRKVNSFTQGDAYPLLQIDAILSRLPRAMFISSLDLKDAYWQIPLHPASRNKTAFTIPGKPLYQFKVMPFALMNASQTMTRLMDKVIPASLRNEVFVYLDDLLVVSDTFESHLAVLTTVAGHIQKAGLTLNIGKSHFCMRSVKYLGHVIGEGVIRTDLEKIEAMVNYPIPRTLKALRSFLGMTGWYSKFISNYADIVAPLTDLVRPKCRFTMSQAGLEAFTKLKKAMCQAPVLHSPDFWKPFYIHCDASSYAIGGVLVQKTEGNKGDEYPIAFVSKKLSKAQRNYSVTEQECLAAIICIKRAYEGALDEEVVAEVGNDYESPLFEADEYKTLRDTVEANGETVPDLKVMDGKVFRRTKQVRSLELAKNFAWKLWVPKGMIPDILREAHDSPTAVHGGVRKTLERVHQMYYWPDLVNEVKKYVGKCEVYHYTKCVFLKALKKLSADVVVKYMKQELFHTYGVPETVFSDNVTQFKGEVFRTLMRENWVTQVFTEVHSPQANASERKVQASKEKYPEIHEELQRSFTR
ncbi:uncharacterized protein LOC123257320 [Drosophila ananassae]|uniref:uncharacterized protein LOC123257320 n=1 Tax=Drosophila ananassae TaxID=7217 RepID=UPI001CFF6A3E|nr:uncharacterized protein LOC123257320 [Drosophila ananassae]